MESTIKLSELSREDLNSLRQAVITELEARAFEEKLRRELQSHMNREAWIQSHHEATRRRR